MKIEDYIPTGKQNAINGSTLAERAHITPRTLCEAIKEAREKRGAAICASNAEPMGYYMAADAAELQEYCRTLGHRARELYITRQALIKVLRSISDAEAGQGALLPTDHGRQ